MQLCLFLFHEYIVRVFIQCLITFLPRAPQRLNLPGCCLFFLFVFLSLSVGCVVLHEDLRLVRQSLDVDSRKSSLSFQTVALLWSRQMASVLHL